MQVIVKGQGQGGQPHQGATVSHDHLKPAFASHTSEAQGFVIEQLVPDRTDQPP